MGLHACACQESLALFFAAIILKSDPSEPAGPRERIRDMWSRAGSAESVQQTHRCTSNDKWLLFRATEF